MIILKGDYRGIDRELDRLSKLPGVKTQLALDAVLHTGFAFTQADVDIDTTSLKGSGKTKTSADSNTWRGEISYGGLSLGINNPVTYAIYEKARGGSHDFFGRLPTLHSRYVKVIKNGLSK